jgi:hypothetical protein
MHLQKATKPQPEESAMSNTNTAAVPHAPQDVGRPPRDTRTFWRVVLAVVAPLAPLALAVATLITPYSIGDDGDAMLSGIAADPGAMQTAVWFSLLAGSTAFAATIAVAWVCRRHAPRLTAVGAALALLGLAAGATMPSQELVELVAVRKGINPTTIGTLNDAISNQPTVVAALLIFLLGMFIGQILLGIALWRSRVAPRWMALALIVATPLHLAPAGAGNSVAALSWALTAVGYAAASLALLRMSNDTFDLPAHPAAAKTVAEVGR